MGIDLARKSPKATQTKVTLGPLIAASHRRFTDRFTGCFSDHLESHRIAIDKRARYHTSQCNPPQDEWLISSNLHLI